MKIAIPTLLTRKVEKITYGGTEAVAYTLAEELVKRGNEVTLYASSDSKTSAILESVVDTETAKLKVMGFDLSTLYYLQMCNQIVKDASKFDIIHDNMYMYYFFSAFAPYIKTPIIHTVHNSFFQNADFKKILSDFGNHANEHLAFVSSFAQNLAGNPKNSSVVYNGIDTTYFSFATTQEQKYILWLGRMVPEKGAEHAAAAMHSMQYPFVLNYPLEGKIDTPYWESTKKYLSEEVKIVDTKQGEKVALYQKAKSLLFTSVWEEPFGLVMIEAMSCGTPVIAYAKGATGEIVIDGKTGFLVNPSDDDIRGDFIIKKTGIDGLKEAVERIYVLSDPEYTVMRQQARAHVENNFSLRKMVDTYEALYKTMIARK